MHFKRLDFKITEYMICRVGLKDKDTGEDRDIKNMAGKTRPTGCSPVSGPGDSDRADFIQLNSIKHFPKVTVAQKPPCCGFWLDCEGALGHVNAGTCFTF